MASVRRRIGRQSPDCRDWIRIARIDSVGGSEAAGERELLLIQIDGDDRVCPERPRRGHGGKTHPADPEDRDRLPRLELDGSKHAARAGDDGAAQDGRDDRVRIGRQWNEELLVHHGQFRPREERRRRDCLAAIQVHRDRVASAIGARREPRHPGDHHTIAVAKPPHGATASRRLLPWISWPPNAGVGRSPYMRGRFE